MADRTSQIVALAVLLCCLAASVFLSPSVAASAGRSHLVYGDTAESGDPPEVAVGIAMGAFRGLFVNMLWIKANDRKEQGRYYDAVDLARTITRLQPRFPRVWAFHAWNLAYNISVTTNTPEERWNWVSQGIRLLRDEGIPKNPSDLLLHKELGWIFLHKVQGYMDDANGYYKRQHAREWTIALGPPPARDADHLATAKRTEQIADWLSRLAAAPDTLDDAMNAKDADGNDLGIRALVDRLRIEAQIDLRQPYFKDDGSGVAEVILTLLEEQRSIGRAIQAINVPMRPREGINYAAIAILNDMKVRPAFVMLVRHLRKRMIIDKYHMDPDRMVRYTQELGPLDWRHPATHAIYWAYRGVEEAKSRATESNKKDLDFLNTNRVVIQAVQELFRTGDLYFDIFNPQFYLGLPSVDFIPVYGQILDDMAKQEAQQFKDQHDLDPRKYSARPYQLYAAGYENFLKDAVRYLYRRGDIEAAEKYREKLIDYKGQNYNDPNRINELSVPLKQWVIDEVANDERFTVPNVALQEIAGSLQAAYLDGLLAGNMKIFNEAFEYARQIHGVFVQRQVFNTPTNAEEAARMEIVARDFDRAAGQILAVLIATAGIPDGPMMYGRAPEDLRVRAYVLMERMGLKERFEATGAPFDRLFQPPDGVPAYRAKLEADDKARGQNRGNLEQK